MKRALIAASILLHSVALVWAQPTGVLRGTVTDAATGAPLRSVTLRLVGTPYGTFSAADGSFVLANLKPGTYVLEATLLGYAAVQQSGIRIRPGDTTVVHLRLRESALVLGQEIVVIGERPLLNVEETQSLRLIQRERLQESGATTLGDALVQQVGVLLQDNTLHIRGSRGYELAYRIDGISAQDPLAGTGLGASLSTDAVEEIELLTGGFSPEFGQSTGGVLNVRTAEPTRQWQLRLSLRPEWRLHRRNPYDRDTHSTYTTERYRLSLSGTQPLARLLPTLPGQLGLVLSLEGSFSDGLVPEFARVRLRSGIVPAWLARRQDNWSSAFLKLTYQPTEAIRLAYMSLNSFALNQNTRTLQTTLEYLPPDPGYQYAFQGHFDGALTYGTRSHLHLFTWQQSFGPRFFAEFRLGYATWHARADANGRHYTEYSEPQDIPTLPPQYYDTGDSLRSGIIPGDGFYDVGTAWSWREHFAREITLRTDLTAILAEKNQLKSGIELQLQELQYAEIFAPWIPPLGLNHDFFSVRPRLLTLYAQHQRTSKGLVLNYGLRLEAWAPGRLVDDAIESDLPTITEAQRNSYRSRTLPLLGLRWKLRLSPRLGIAHPITPDADALLQLRALLQAAPSAVHLRQALSAGCQLLLPALWQPRPGPGDEHLLRAGGCATSSAATTCSASRSTTAISSATSRPAPCVHRTRAWLGSSSTPMSTPTTPVPAASSWSTASASGAGSMGRSASPIASSRARAAPPMRGSSSHGGLYRSGSPKIRCPGTAHGISSSPALHACPGSLPQ
jgi:hypothetical protein